MTAHSERLQEVERSTGEAKRHGAKRNGLRALTVGVAFVGGLAVRGFVRGLLAQE